MDRLALAITVVNQAARWAVAHVSLRIDRALGLVHHVTGGAVLVGAVLLVATAGPRWRSRVGAVAVAMILVAIVLAGWAVPAGAGTPAPAGRSAGGGAPADVVAVLAVALLLLTIRFAFRLVWAVVRVLLILVGILRLVAVFGVLATMLFFL
jgi:hypothetical protein